MELNKKSIHSHVLISVLFCAEENESINVNYIIENCAISFPKQLSGNNPLKLI